MHIHSPSYADLCRTCRNCDGEGVLGVVNGEPIDCPHCWGTGVIGVTMEPESFDPFNA